MKLLLIAFAFLLATHRPLTATAQVIDTLVETGRYQLHFHITKGTGVPILFESGGGNEGNVWDNLIHRLYDSIPATFITYDRAGMGKSGIDTTHIDIQNEVKELSTALNKLGYTKDIFLVAHSFGGAYATLFSAKNETRVTGAVLIDIALPCYLTPERSKAIPEPYRKDLPAIKKSHWHILPVGEL